MSDPTPEPGVTPEPVPSEPQAEAVAEPLAEAVAEPMPAEAVAEPQAEAVAEAVPAVPAEPQAEAVAEAVPAVPGEPQAEAVAEPIATDAVEPLPVELAPADAQLVPLEALAPAIQSASVSRRAFLGFGLALTGGLVGAAALARFTPVFAEATPDISPVVSTYDPTTKKWVYVVDTTLCIGCGLCVAACKEENHIPEDPEFTRTWIERHSTTEDGALHIDSPDGGINGFPPYTSDPTAAGQAVESSFFMPRLCMQCANSPCTKVCPVGATYRTVDGIILVDARRCIGCGYCVVACPYGARYIVPAGDRAPNDTPGVADKCTWCYHRISRNQLPACVEVCPVGARKFGDASDPNSEMAVLVRERAPEQYRPEYGTDPRVYYLGPVTEEA